MSTWQRVEWDEDEYVIAPAFFVGQSATWPVLVRFENFDGTINRNVSNRHNLFGEEGNYKSIMVAPVVWPATEPVEVEK
jgi:hypothetical protein